MTTENLKFFDNNEKFDDVTLTLSVDQLLQLQALRVDETVLMLVKYHDADHGLIDAAVYFLWSNEGIKVAFYNLDKQNLYFYNAVENDWGL